jgi:tetratricopeptide (TPR) repeat protein
LRPALSYGNKGDHDREIADETRAIELNPRLADAYVNRAIAYSYKGDHDQAIEDDTRAIELNPQLDVAYMNRGFDYGQKGDYDRAIADETRAIELNPQDAEAYVSRGAAYAYKGDYNRAMADSDKAIELNPRLAEAYVNRGEAYGNRGNYDQEIADENKAIELKPQLAEAYGDRGEAYSNKGNYDLAIADQNKAIQLKPDYGNGYYGRGIAYAAKGDPVRALIDLRAAMPLIPTSDKRHEQAQERIADLEKQLATAEPLAAAASPSQAVPASLHKRVALVIGNGAYLSPLLPKLTNPPHDAAVVARALKSLGFDVDVVTDVTKPNMEDALARLAHKARDADLTLIFYAGHGLQDQGRNYLAPIDASLSDETDLRRRFVRLDDVLDDLADAKGARILLLDACRDNDAVEALRAALPSSRSVGVSRGLALIPRTKGQLVAFATQPDQVAADGDGPDSPFTTALVAHLAEPGVDIETVLTRVRIDVAKATNSRQIPEVSDSLLTEVYLQPVNVEGDKDRLPQ